MQVVGSAAGYGAWARRYSEVVDWPVGRKTALVTGLLAPYMILTGVFASWLISPDTVPIDVPRFERFLVGWSGVVLLCFALSLAVARRGGAGTWTAYFFVVAYSSSVAYLCWLFGSTSTSFMMMLPIAVLFVSMIFDPRMGWVAFGIGIVDWGGLALLELHGVVPYAPALLERNVDALLSPRWFLFQFTVILIMIVFSLAVSHVSANLRRAQQAELSAMNQRLERGNELIRRFVPEQLARRMLGDDYEEPARPERRRLTIFFSDIAGFTAASDKLDPEDLSALLNEYLSEMVAIAEAHGGTVNQFVGDGIMILFGAPEWTSDRDHAQRAVRMGLAMQERMEELREKWSREGVEAPFRIRCGINTGPASVGNFGSEGRMTYTAIGRETNLAARIEAHCDPDGILISDSTWELVRDEIPCRAKGEIQAKGIPFPVAVYEVARDGRR